GLLAARSMVVRQMLGEASMAAVDAHKAGDGIVAMLVVVGRAMLPLMLGIVLIAVFANVAQVGLHLTPAKLRPNLGALNPLRGLGRLFKGRSLVNLLMGVLKMSLVAMAAYSAVHGRIAQIIGVQALSQTQMLQLGGEVLYSI